MQRALTAFFALLFLAGAPTWAQAKSGVVGHAPGDELMAPTFTAQSEAYTAQSDTYSVEADAERYAEKAQQTSEQAKSFRGGDRVVISVGLGTLIVLGLLIILL